MCIYSSSLSFFFFFFNDTATTEIYTLSLHDALPIYVALFEKLIEAAHNNVIHGPGIKDLGPSTRPWRVLRRSEEHTSELQSPCNLVCRLLLEKKKKHVSQRVRTEPIAP